MERLFKGKAISQKVVTVSKKCIMMKKLWIWGIVVGAILLINVLIKPENGALWLIFTAVFLGIWYVLFQFILRRAFKAATNLHHPIRYIFDETEVKVESGSSQTVHSWSAFERTVELPEWFLLYQNKVVFNPIPKSAFHSETELSRFRNLLKEKVGT